MTTGRLLLFAALAACKPDLGTEDWLVTSTRILAVRADPPEAKPGTPATYTALVASPLGTIENASILWRWCEAPKPPGDDNVVSTTCLDTATLDVAATGPSIVATTPTGACSLFGPDTPPGGFRPSDPDPTGGYYQPLRADLMNAPTAFALVRILCDLAVAPSDIATQYATAYVPNANPRLQPLGMAIDGRPASPQAIPPATSVQLEASWSPSDAETYAYFNPASQSLSTKRESMTVAWFATGGTLSTESTGRGEDNLRHRRTTRGRPRRRVR